MVTKVCSGRSGGSSRAAGSWKLYLAVLLVLVTLYGLTAQRGPAWQDSGIFQVRILNFDLVGHLGLALSHPLLILLGKIFSFLPVRSLAWRMNFLCAVCAAFAAANVALLVRRLAPRPAAAAWIAAGFFGLAHTLWWLATICESQTLLVALFTVELNILVSLLGRPREHLALAIGLVNGLALSAHNLALLALPAYALTVLYLCARRGLHWRALIWLAAGWLIGAAGFLGIVFHTALDVGPAAAVHSALFGDSWRGAVLGGSLNAVAMGCGYIVYNFPNVALGLMILGLPAMRKCLPRPGAWIFGYLWVVYLAFAIRYQVPDQFMFFLPFYALTAVLAGIAIGRFDAGGRRRAVIWLAAASIVIAPILYAAAPAACTRFGWRVPGRSDLPYRDVSRYWLSPWKGSEDSADRFAREALGSVPPGGVIIADGTSFPPLLWVQRTKQVGQGVHLLPLRQADRQNVPIDAPNVFVVSNLHPYYPAWLTEVASLQKSQPTDALFRVVWNRPAGPAQED